MAKLLGSDDGISQIQQASDSLNDSVQSAQKQTTDSLTNYYGTFLQANNQVASAQTNLASAQQAEADNNSTAQGLASLAQTGVGILQSNKADDDKLAIAKQNLGNKVQIQQNKEQAASLKLKQQGADADATQELDQLSSNFSQGNGGSFRDPVTGQEGNIGVNQFQAQALQTLAKHTDITPEARKALVQKIYDTVDKHNTVVNTNLDTKLDHFRADNADNAENTLISQLNPLTKTLATLGPTEQAKPITDAIDAKLKEFFQTDNGIPAETKWAIYNRQKKAAIDSYGVHYDKFANEQSFARNGAQAIPQLQQANAAYLTPGNPDYGNFNTLKAKQWTIGLKYGDYTNATSKVGESEKLMTELATNQKQYQDLALQGSQTAGAKVQFDDSEGPYQAALIASSPGYLEKLKASPYANNPAVQTGIRLAQRRLEFQKAQGENDIALADTGVKYQELNLADAHTFYQLLSHYVQKKAAGIPLTTAETQAAGSLDNISQSNPTLSALVQTQVDHILGKNATEPDYNVLQQQLNTVRPAIAQEKAALLEKQRQQASLLQKSFSDVYQAGLAVPDDQLQQVIQQGAQKHQANLQRAQQEVQFNISQPKTYGTQANFNPASTFAPDVDANGRVRIAPRTKLATYTVNGQNIVTPIAAGVTDAPPSQNHGFGGGAWGAQRTGHQHAGVDFALHPGEKAVALVSGTAYVDSTSDPAGYGTFIDIKGDNGYTYRYAHQNPFVKTGDHITAGQAISTPNNSGHNEGPHLHFEVLPPGNDFDSNGKYKPRFGYANTVDPIQHMAQLTTAQSNVVQPRASGDPNTAVHPQQKVDTSTFLSGNGGAINGGIYQNITSKQTSPANAIYTNQRPQQQGMYTGKLGADLSAGYDVNDSFGYSYLKQNPAVLKQLNQTAQRLGVPTHWIASIIGNESDFNPRDVANGGLNRGLFNFGSDSFDGLTATQIQNMSPVDQIKLFERYMNENNWKGIKQKYGDNTNIGQFYAPLRFGNIHNKRQRVIDSPDIANEYVDDYKTNYGSELLRLGRGGGFRYAVPGFRNDRSRRSAAISNDYVAYCPTCSAMEDAGSFVPHTHELEG